MLDLNDWFRGKVKKQFTITSIFILLISFFFLSYSYFENTERESLAIQSLQSIVSQGIAQNDRKLIELALTLSTNQLKARSIFLCKNGIEMIRQGDINYNCSNLKQRESFFERWRSFSPIGMSEYQVTIVLPFVVDSGFLFLLTLITLLLVLSNLRNILAIQRIIKSELLNPLMKSLSSQSEKLDKSDELDESEASKIEIKEIKDILLTRQKVETLEKENAISKAKSRLASQIAHDIRSPVAVLNMLVKNSIQGMPEDTRVILRNQVDRIQDIANDLLAKNKVISSGQILEDKVEERIEFLPSCIERIVTEKRIELRPYIDINIIAEVYGQESYGIFAKINVSDFKRILSNIINNALEAFLNKKGNITVSLKSKDDQTLILTISDDGRGIPLDVLPTLAQEGVTYGKEKSDKSGSGLGLYHAKSIIQKWGGDFKIESQLGQGTQIILTLPKAPAPRWFVPQINIKANSVLLILDDDSGIHITWDNRFSEIGLARQGVEVLHFSNPTDIRNWLNAHSKEANGKHVFCLSDYELLGFEETGLDLIEELGLYPDRAILVTSHYENEDIRKRCDNLGIRLISKMLAGSVPIHLLDEGESGSFASPSESLSLIGKSAKIKAFKAEYVLAIVSQEKLLNELTGAFEKQYFSSYSDFLNSTKNYEEEGLKSIICFFDSEVFKSSKEQMMDKDRLKHCLLLGENESPFDIEDDHDFTTIIYRQRDRVIPEIIEQKFK